jgi:acyl-CoA reductase-like NAD-dependent aldehyde dehydrogenase
MTGAMIWGHVIAGQSRPGEGGLFQEYDPATGAKGYQIARGNSADVADAVASAKAAQRDWADLRPIRRGRVLTAIAEGLRADLAHFARVDQAETGRRLATCLGEVELAA